MKSKDDAVRELVMYHFAVEPMLVRVYRIVSVNEAAPDEPIKLLEVNDGTIPTGSIEPFAFGPSTEIPYATVIAEVTQDEYERIRRDREQWPRGWDLDLAETFDRQQVA